MELSKWITGLRCVLCRSAFLSPYYRVLEPVQQRRYLLFSVLGQLKLGQILGKQAQSFKVQPPNDQLIFASRDAFR